MYPIIFDSEWIGLTGPFQFSVPTYFAAVSLGFLAAAWLIIREAEGAGIDQSVIRDFAIWSLLVGVFGGRVAHLLFDGFLWDYIYLATDPFALDGRGLPGSEACFANAQCLEAQQSGHNVGAVCNPADGLCYPRWDPLRAVKFWAGGLTVYGALLGAFAAGWYYFRKVGVSAWKGMDLAGLAVPLGMAIGRLGCVGAGCGFGKVCNISWLCIRFPPGSPAYRTHLENRATEVVTKIQEAGASLPVYPTQPIEVGYNFAIFLFVYFYVWPRKKFDGQIILTSAILYGIGRASVEFLRADQRGAIAGLPTSQFISLVVIGIAGYCYFAKANR